MVVRKIFLKEMLLFILLIIFISILYGVVTVSASTYDLLVYFEHYSRIKEIGLWYFLKENTSGLKIAEFGIYAFYGFLPSGLNLLSFSILNYFFILIIAFIVYFKINKKLSEKWRNGFFLFFLLIAFWYPSYQALLWVWRNYIATLLVLMLFARFNLSGILVSLCFHLAAIVYTPFVYFCMKIGGSKKISPRLLMMVSLIVGVLIGFFSRVSFPFFSPFFSGGGNWLDIYAGSGFVGGIVAIYMLAAAMLFLFEKNIYSNHLSMVTMLFVLSGVSILYIDNHFVVNRITIMSAIIFIITISCSWCFLTMKKRFFYLFFIGLGVFPTLASMIKYLDLMGLN